MKTYLRWGASLVMALAAVVLISYAGTVQAGPPPLEGNICEYPQPPDGYHWEGMEPFPECGGYLVED